MNEYVAHVVGIPWNQVGSPTRKANVATICGDRGRIANAICLVPARVDARASRLASLAVVDEHVAEPVRVALNEIGRHTPERDVATVGRDREDPSALVVSVHAG